MRLLPEYRKAARSFEDNEVGFGTVDCTIHTNLCHMVSGLQSISLQSGTKRGFQT